MRVIGLEREEHHTCLCIGLAYMYMTKRYFPDLKCWIDKAVYYLVTSDCRYQLSIIENLVRMFLNLQ